MEKDSNGSRMETITLAVISLAVRTVLGVTRGNPEKHLLVHFIMDFVRIKRAKPINDALDNLYFLMSKLGFSKRCDCCQGTRNLCGCCNEYGIGLFCFCCGWLFNNKTNIRPTITCGPMHLFCESGMDMGCGYMLVDCQCWLCANPSYLPGLDSH